MTTETRQDYEKRMAAEYEVYAKGATEREEFVLNYMNWLAGRKIEESQNGG